MTNDSPNASDQWTVKTSAKPGKPGSVEVTFQISNVAFGEFPPFTVTSDWKPGHELADAEGHACWMVGQALHFLTDDLIDRGRELIGGGVEGPKLR